MTCPSNYDKYPSLQVSEAGSAAVQGWTAIGERLSAHSQIAVDLYSGLHENEVLQALIKVFGPDRVVDTRTALLSEAEINALVEPYLGDDPVFGHLCPLEIESFFDQPRLEALRFEASSKGRVLVVGPGAHLVAPTATLVYADMPRWEGQLRQRRGEVSNFGVANRGTKASLQYKRAFFVDWRVLDRYKRRSLERWDFALDTTDSANPKLVEGSALRRGWAEAVSRPFRLVPFFDPGPWGGQWMKEVCGLDQEAENYAWCFDGVPEENSLLFQFGDVTFESPAINLVFAEPQALLGANVYHLFGAEFPIRFDLLDTMGGGNLSLQVHPTRQYARSQFGLAYTQDESYYLLDAGSDAKVYLGLRDSVNPTAIIAALEDAHSGGAPFDADAFAGSYPARRHDHFSIPAGTIHCSGRNSMVLEISATPYIFTFKLWDWGRPRPTHIRHGAAVIDWARDPDWVKRELIGQVELLAEGDGWREERTGLHALEFIETRRHWFDMPVHHDTQGNLNVLNLVEGDEVTIESPSGAFEPFVVHYAETFVVPAAVGPYVIRPTATGKQCATIKAFVREPGG